MSTCNFRLPKTKYHYTIGVDQEMEDWEYQEHKENVVDQLEEKFKSGHSDGKNWIGRDELILFSIPFELYDREYKEWNSVYIHVTITGGYYAGAMYDINTDDLEGYTLTKTNERKIETIKNKIERILKGCTFLLRRVAVFSNGEGMYEQARA